MTLISTWFFAGIVAAIVHATCLWHGTRKPREQLKWLCLRFLVVTAVLVGGAIAGQILAAAAGWATGFAVCSTLLLIRSAR